MRCVNKSTTSGVKYIYVRKPSGVLNMQRQNSYLIQHIKNLRVKILHITKRIKDKNNAEFLICSYTAIFLNALSKSRRVNKHYI